MLAQVWSAALAGVDSFPVRVEVNVSSGLPTFSVVGLPHGSVREGRDRVLTALRHHGLDIPPRKIVVNLAPADVRKEGSALDLPIAVGLLVGTGRIPRAAIEGWGFVGELGLDGCLRPLRGALSHAEGCRRAGLRALALPWENAAEAAAVTGIDVAGVRDLPGLLAVLDGASADSPAGPSSDSPAPIASPPRRRAEDLSDVKGQEHAKRALEIAAAGGHHILLVGPPGVGKSMLARRLPGLLPDLDLDEALEVTRVHSVAGLLPAGSGLLRERPFRAPHHTVSGAGLLGGGSPPQPGELSLAHHGVLFLDELAEFQRPVLEGLRQPLEDGRVHIARARHRLSFPAHVQLVGAMNPCPCGYYGDGSDRCSCDPPRVVRYRARASGPLLDRVDLHVPVTQPPADLLAGGSASPGSADVRARVERARARQMERYGEGPGGNTNAAAPIRELLRALRLTAEGSRLLTGALTRLRMSARAYHRVLRVARTIADLERRTEVERRHVAEALGYRGLDRAVR